MTDTSGKLEQLVAEVDAKLQDLDEVRSKLAQARAVLDEEVQPQQQQQSNPLASPDRSERGRSTPAGKDEEEADSVTWQLKQEKRDKGRFSWLTGVGSGGRYTTLTRRRVGPDMPMPTDTTQLDDFFRHAATVRGESPMNWHQATVYFCCVKEDSTLVQKILFMAASIVIVAFQFRVCVAVFHGVDPNVYRNDYACEASK
eukprot:SAG11_NODE_13941_length_632_cov_1.056285_1_plen_199_part_10